MSRSLGMWLPLLAAFAVGLPAQASVSRGPEVSAQVAPEVLARLNSLSRPAAADAQTVSLTLQRFQTEQGLQVVWQRSTALPMVDVQLAFDAGSARDEASSGLAMAVNRLMGDSTTVRSGQAWREAMEALGARFDRTSQRDMAIVGLRVLSDPALLQPALNLWLEAIANPAFDPADWQRLQDGLRLGARQRQQSPAALAGTLFQQRLFQGHPYAAPPTGLMASIDRLTTEQLRAFHRRYYVSANATLVVVGPVTEAQVRDLAQQVSQRLPVGTAAPPIPEPAVATTQRRVHRPYTAEQTQILIGQLGVPRHHPDYVALQVANDVLGGGGFSSLMMRRLREQRGMTYGVSSSLTAMRVTGPWQLRFATRHDQATEALTLVQSILRSVAQDGLPEADIAQSLTALRRSWPMGLTSQSQIVSQLTVVGFYGLPDDYLEQYRRQLAALTPAEVNAALRRWLKPEAQLIVTVGPTSP